MLHSATDRAFIATIIESPDDDAPRLIYADWLDEQGEADRAEFIRLQIREARMAVHDPELPAIRARANELRQAHHIEWASRLPQHEGVHWEMFRRGFFVAVKFEHPDSFFAHVNSVFAAGPIQELRLHQFGHFHAPRLAGTEQLRSVRTLDLNDGNKLANVGTEALMGSRYLKNLSALKLGVNGLGSAGVRSIAMASYARSLKYLRLEHNDLFDEGLRFIADSPALTHLEQLDLEHTRTGDDGLRFLAASRRIRRLRGLYLSHNQIADEGLIALSRSDIVTDVRELFLSRNSITCAGLSVLANSPKFAQLQGLYLRRNRIRDEGARALAESPFLGHIRELQLSENPISPGPAMQLQRRFGSRVYLDES
jgi:uncharacterized protein (TIGR02996 family)